mmetsp:Transcript_29029/g.53120  ORF Transcript_29029/g.53120 Transcript_29029/m.53120 type:complete len:230 (+) Transcript_29029:80-769(+)
MSESSSSSSSSKSRSSKSSSSSNNSSSTSISSTSIASGLFSASSAAASIASKLKIPAVPLNWSNPLSRSLVSSFLLVCFLPPLASLSARAASSASFCSISASNFCFHAMNVACVQGVPSSRRLRTACSSNSASDSFSSFFCDSNSISFLAFDRSASLARRIICACIDASSKPFTLLSASQDRIASQTTKMRGMPSFASASLRPISNISCRCSSARPLSISKSSVGRDSG